MAKKVDSNVYVGALITSLLSAILFIFEDFAGWYNYNQYVESWGLVAFSFEQPISLVVFGAAAIVLLFSSYISYLKISGKKIPKDSLEKAFLGSLVIFVLSLVGGLYFIISMLWDEPTNWWLGPTFYAGVIGAGLTALFFKLALQGEKK